MESATVQFQGRAFHWAIWNRILRDADFRISGGVAEHAVYAAGGCIIAGQSRVSSLPHAWVWDFTLKQSRDFRGWLKWYSLLISAFALPQSVTVIVSSATFENPESLRHFAEAALIERFTSEELISQGVIHPKIGLVLP